MKKLVLILALVALVATPAMAAFTGGEFYWYNEFTGLYTQHFTNGKATISNPTLGFNVGWKAELEEYGTPSVPGAWTPDSSATYTAFCVEREVTFYPGREYWATFDNVAMSGGSVSNGGSPDAISEMTAYIVEHSSALADAYSWDQVRDAIWYAEDELTNKNALAIYVEDTLGKSKTKKDDDAKVVNSWEIDTSGMKWIDLDNDGTDDTYAWIATDVQSHVVTVPAPGAMLLGSLGLGFVGWLRRRNSL